MSLHVLTSSFNDILLEYFVESMKVYYIHSTKYIVIQFPNVKLSHFKKILKIQIKREYLREDPDFFSYNVVLVEKSNINICFPRLSRNANNMVIVKGRNSI